MNKYLIATIGFGLGMIANSFDVRKTEPFRFTNPIPMNMSCEQQQKHETLRPYMIDTNYSLEFFGQRLPIIKVREITNPRTNKKVGGVLKDNGNIHTGREIYELQRGYDSQWYNITWRDIK